jgi:hypothetical protein
VAHHRDAGVDEAGDGRGEGGAAFDLHRLDAAFLEEAAAVAEELGEAVVGQAEGEVADHEGFGLGAERRRRSGGASCPR